MKTDFNPFYQYIQLRANGNLILNVDGNLFLKNYHTETIEKILNLTFKKDFYYT